MVRQNTALRSSDIATIVLHPWLWKIFWLSTAIGCVHIKTGSSNHSLLSPTSNKQAASAALLLFPIVFLTTAGCVPCCCFLLLCRSSSSLSNLVLGRPSVSLSNPVLFCGLAIIMFIHNIGSYDVHIVVGLHEHEDHERQDIGHARPVLNCFGEKLFAQYSYCLSQKNGVEACILIHGPLGPCSGTMVRHRDDDS